VVTGTQEVSLSVASAVQTPPPARETISRRGFLGVAGATVVSLAAPFSQKAVASRNAGSAGGTLIVLPEDGRAQYFAAIGSAQSEIRIEICVLEDPQILQHIQAALERGVSVRVIVDYGKYNQLEAERDHLAEYLTSAGGQLHLSNPIFPRSFPKIILIDSELLLYGSACLDQTTFLRYRDFATTSNDQQVLSDLHQLFENDWAYSAPVGQQAPAFNPTPPISSSNLIISPVNGAAKLVGIFQGAQQTLDVYTELLGNLTLESELAAATSRGVAVRLISPERVAGGSQEIQERQLASLTALAAAGVNVHVNGGADVGVPYMHARAAVVDGQTGYLGSVSLSPNATTVNREVGLIVQDKAVVQQLEAQFESDYNLLTRKF
jgi:cardiolipin synthase A/B